ncbi:AraC family transcriptional regulator [Paenibacillus sp. PL91]|uniref:AraC family transcriptional regulator n=1 Tax=Paenibacillus sp. PL91 TaxID=2729538 RepID=UPI00145F2835|nr:AraC family transcriptional regulator [Paenibacillus sp. PL91]MBC9203203.1 helix-turn-helix transcriptional regulator [Paenibacillus sp. PL91]
MYNWPKSEERLNRYARLLQGESLTIHVYYWGTVQNLATNAVHKHSFFEVCYVAGGTGFYEEGGVAYPLHEGVLFCSRPNIRHQIRNVDQLDLLYAAFELDEKLSKPDEFDFYNHALNTGPIWMENQQHSPTAEIWRSLLIPSDECFAVPIAVLQQLAHALILTFPTIVGGKNRSSETILPASNAAILISRAKLYIRDNLGGAITLSEVARYINVSERHLSRLFSQSVHESFSMLVRHERIRAAEQLLSQTAIPIKTIAEQCGFSSVHYFSRTFAEAKGIPPAAFRVASRRSSRHE